MDDHPAIAVITGAGRGIGAALAAGLSDRGFHVLVTDVDPEAARRVAEALPGPATAMPLDVRDASAHRAVAAAAATLGEVTAWVNNAGVLATGWGWELDEARTVAAFEINTLGVVHGCRAAVEVMRRGEILNLVSLSGLGPTPGFAAYGASKAAALSWTQALDTELGQARRPIRVRALCPDVVDTDMVSAVAHEPRSALLFTGTRWLRPDEVVDAALALMGSRRGMRTLPAHRAAVLRLSALVPGLGRIVTPMVARFGDRRRRAR